LAAAADLDRPACPSGNALIDGDYQQTDRSADAVAQVADVSRPDILLVVIPGRIQAVCNPLKLGKKNPRIARVFRLLVTLGG